MEKDKATGKNEWLMIIFGGQLRGKQSMHILVGEH
jgi:hypothetical protein